MKSFKLLTSLCLLFIFACSSDEDNDATSSSPENTPNQNQTPSEPARTTIPDSVFEEYLVSVNVDNVVDGSVLTSNLVNVQQIVVDNLNITDLTGIADCPNLFNLWLQNCNVSQLNVSSNTNLKFIYFDNNNVSSINVNALPLLEKLSGRNNNLTSINVSNNPELELLEISDNEINEIDVSGNEFLFRLDVTGNPLTCIQASQEQIDNPNLEWILDDNDILSLECN